MKKFFTDINCIEELKEAYRRLAMRHHPDRGGDLEDMKTINNEYDELFERFKDVHKSIKKDAESKYYKSAKATAEQAGEFRAIIYALIALDGLVIELCGRWIWVTGETKTHKDTLKSLGFRWCSKKTAWSWHKEGEGSFSNGKWSLDDIRRSYGSTVFEGSDDNKLYIGA